MTDETNEPQEERDQQDEAAANAAPELEPQDAAKLSDEAAAEAARAFLGTAEPEPEGVSPEEAKAAFRRAGAVAEAEPEPVVEPEPEPEPVSPAPAAAAPADEKDDRRWYVIHTYSGYENKVKKNLEHRIDSMGMKNKIFGVVVPEETEITIQQGQRKTVNRKMFPGYVLVNMIELLERDEASNEAWFVVRNTPGVTSFVGSGNRPIPLLEREVKTILKDRKSVV